MTIEGRVNEIMETLKAFRKEKFYKDEMLQELFDLQAEIVDLTFNETHSDNSNLKLYDVERHLTQMNKDQGHPADDELQRFHEGCNVITNAIKAEISGSRGEYKAMKTLGYLHGKHLILRNIEFRSGDCHTELDAIVITPKAVFIVEVKNTGKDIFIDEEGNYYRTGEFLRWDCNLGEKMKLREAMLLEILKRFGFENIPINNIVVFTNNRIEIQNKYKGFRTCFLSQLCSIIEGVQSGTLYSEEEMNNISNAIAAVRYKEPYPFGYDMKMFKQNFAVLMAKLECAASGETPDEVTAESGAAEAFEVEEEVEYTTKKTDEEEPVRRNGIISFIRAATNSDRIRSIGRTVAVASVMLAVTAITESFGKGGL